MNVICLIHLNLGGGF